MLAYLIALVKKHGAKLFILIVPAVLAVIKPNGTFKSADAQTLLTLGGIVISGGMFLAETLITNLKEYGLSKAALYKTVDEDEAWVRDHSTAVRWSFEAAEEALEKLPGVPQDIATLKAKYAALQARLEQLFSELTASVNDLKGAAGPKVPVFADNGAPVKVSDAVLAKPVYPPQDLPLAPVVADGVRTGA